ncbi:MAG: OmpA family protein [Reichenbachiella sp.]
MRHLLIFLYLASCITSFAQADNEKKISKKELIEQADYYFFKENFEKAIVLYDSILHNYPKNHYVIYHQYVAHHLTDGRGTDLSSLQEFERNEGHTDKFYNYWLGRIHHERYEFDIARKHFEAFLDLEIYRTKEIIHETEKRRNESIRAQSFYLSPNEYEVVALAAPINSKFNDLSPAFFGGHNELLFVSSRPEMVTEEIANSQMRIYHTEKTSSYEWNAPTSLDYLGNISDKNAKIEVVNNDGRLFVYKENSEQGELYYSEPTENRWSDFKQFHSNLKDNKIESHFFINDDENIVFFSSISSTGDLDIYQSELNSSNNRWSDPSPVPGLLNSKFDEDSPFLSHDGKELYFSSNRPESIGGFDIFRSEWSDNTQSWNTPINIGFPINTIDDEISFQLNEDNISGFFSSNRIHGEGDFDIYHFHKQGKVLISGNVYDEITGAKLDGVQIDFKPLKNADETFRAATNENGFFKKEILQDEQFIVELSVNGQIVKTEQLKSQHDDLKKSFTKNFEISLPKKLDEQTDFLALYDRNNERQYEKIDMLGSKYRAGSKAMLKNIYFDIKSDHLKEESTPVLEKLLQMMKNSEKLNIQIEGHTDDSGPDKINQILSGKRAVSVKNFLVNNGVSAQRIGTKGYGSSRPLASNDDEKDGRELNRRIEIIAIE